MKKMRKSVKRAGFSEARQMYFINGKMKFRTLKFMDGIPIDEFYMKNLDPITALQDGHFELLDELNRTNLNEMVDLKNDSANTAIYLDDPHFELSYEFITYTYNCSSSTTRCNARPTS